jgi:hypothetical protein
VGKGRRVVEVTESAVGVIASFFFKLTKSGWGPSVAVTLEMRTSRENTRVWEHLEDCLNMWSNDRKMRMRISDGWNMKRNG